MPRARLFTALKSTLTLCLRLMHRITHNALCHPKAVVGSMFSQVYSMYNKLTHFLLGALIFIAAIYYWSKPANAHLSLS